jgi:hypothetical protein
MPPDDVKTFLLGVGCQKGGTTWLRDYLAQAPECAPGFDTEYTIFDSLDVPEHTWVRPGIVARARSSIDALEAGRPAHPNDLLRLAMMADQRVYYDYFTGLLDRPGASLAMDISPSYALLPVQRLHQVRSEFERRGVRPVALFLMRDPLERVWSQIRMHLRDRGEPHPRPQHVLVERRFANPTTTLRTRYELTVPRLDEVFGPDAVHYAFYEQLFDEPRLRAVNEFLGIDHRPADLGSRLNASPKSAPLPDGTARKVVDHFRGTYEYVEERFGVDLQTLWPSSRFL